MDLQTYFTDFLEQIRPGDDERRAHTEAHTQLRERLASDERLDGLFLSTFLQGSVRRSTAVRTDGDRRPDVDVVIVTRLDEGRCTPDQALQLFVPFLRDHYPGSWDRQGRSLGITDRRLDVDLDLVVTSAPSSADAFALRDGGWSQDVTLEEERAPDEDWRLAPLRIPDRDLAHWRWAHPLAQHIWTRQKNARTNGHYVNVVKALKWRQRIHPPLRRALRGYPLEHLIGVCCPDGLRSVAEGVTRVLEQIRDAYREDAARGRVPVLGNHGLADENVLGRVEPAAFLALYHDAVDAAAKARRALDAERPDESVSGWREIFGDLFPELRSPAPVLGGGRFG